MAAKKKNSKITNINSGFTPDRIGILIFAVLLVYMIISIVQYIKAKHVVGYEVMEGSLSQNNTYTAIALRDEEVVENDTAGSVYYFATEDRRVAKGDLVYIVDEADSLADMSSLTGDASAVSLTDKDYAEIKEDIEDFTSTFNKKFRSLDPVVLTVGLSFTLETSHCILGINRGEGLSIHRKRLRVIKAGGVHNLNRRLCLTAICM